MAGAARSVDVFSVYALLAFAIFCAALAGFWPLYFSKFWTLEETRLHLHVLFVTLWMAALIAQPLLVRARRFKEHRLVGRTSFVLAPLVVISALLLLHSRFSAMTPDEFGNSARFVYLGFMTAIVFALCYGLAIAFRKHMEVHAAFMIGSALTLVDPIAARVIRFYTDAPDDFWLYDFIAPMLIVPVLSGLLLLAKTRAAKLAYGGLIGVFLLWTTGWLTLSRTRVWEWFASWFVSLPLS